MIAERSRERDLVLGRGARGGEVGRAECVDQMLREHRRRGAVGSRSPRRSAPASTSRASRCRGSRSGKRRAALPSSVVADRRPQNTNAPDTAHSPGSAARSNTKVSDGSSRMVRSSFTCRGPRLPDRATTARRARRQARAGRPRPAGHAPHQQIAVVVDRAACTLLGRQALQIVLVTVAKPLLVPGVDGDHQVAREALDQPAGPEIVEAFLVERGDQRAQAGLLLAHRDGADHGAEHQPVGRLVLVARLAGQASRPPPTSPPSTRIASGQANAIGFSGGAWAAAHRRAPPCRHRARAARCAAARPAPARPRIPQGRSARHGPGCRRPPRPRSCGMRERVADLPQRHQPERRRQVERRRRLRGAAHSRLASRTGTSASRDCRLLSLRTTL